LDCLPLKYPIYIISKGRFENPQTAKIFLNHKIDFRIAVEPQEYDSYCKSIPNQFVAKLPFSNLGMGSTPARNWCWEDSKSRGFDFHFLFDDNITSFVLLKAGKRYYKQNAYIALKMAEDFSDRFTNLDIIGYNYEHFVTRATSKAFTINTKCYSGLLIKNSISARWRLKYNEDVDLCLQVLNSKSRCTVSINHYVIDKVSTADKMKGGNQDELYKGNDPKKKMLKAKSLEMLWPQYVKTVERFGRPHHFVDWRKHFNHPLIKKPNYDEIVAMQTELWKTLNIKSGI
jgi:hypothetical protein